MNPDIINGETTATVIHADETSFKNFLSDFGYVWNRDNLTKVNGMFVLFVFPLLEMKHVKAAFDLWTESLE